MVDLAALMGGQPNGLEDALASVKASARASRLYDARLQIELAPVEVSVWTPRAIPKVTTAPPRGGVGSAMLDIVVAGILFAVCILSPREVYGSLVAMVSSAMVVAARDESPPTPAPPPAPPAPPPRVATVIVAPPPPPVDSPPVVVAVRVLTLPVEREAPAGRRGRPSARTSPVLASVSRTRAASAPPAKKSIAPAPAPPPSRPTNALDSAIRDAAGPAPDPAPTLGATNSTTAGDATRPDRPSGSAVASAITQVLPAARACLGDVPDPSRATISFGSDGAVQKVDVSGPAAASAKVMPCLRSALGRAHVPPFAQSSYAASVTVRPL